MADVRIDGEFEWVDAESFRREWTKIDAAADPACHTAVNVLMACDSEVMANMEEMARCLSRKIRA